jgi:hypothetical protein
MYCSYIYITVYNTERCHYQLANIRYGLFLRWMEYNFFTLYSVNSKHTDRTQTKVMCKHFTLNIQFLFSAFRFQFDACTVRGKGNSQILHGSAGILQGFAHADLEQMETPGHTRFLCNGSFSLNPILHM